MSIKYNPHLVGGWPTPLKNMKVSWDDYSQYMEKLKNVPNHQPVIFKERSDMVWPSSKEVWALIYHWIKQPATSPLAVAPSAAFSGASWLRSNMWPRDFRSMDLSAVWNSEHQPRMIEREDIGWVKKSNPQGWKIGGQMILVLQSQPILDTLYFCELVNICSWQKMKLHYIPLSVVSFCTPNAFLLTSPKHQKNPSLW